MIFRNRLKNQKAIFTMGLSCLVIAIVWAMFFAPTTNFGLALSHGIRGVLFGISLPLNFAAFRLATHQRRCGRS